MYRSRYKQMAWHKIKMTLHYDDFLPGSGWLAIIKRKIIFISDSWNSKETGKSIITVTEVNLLQNSFRHTESAFWNGTDRGVVEWPQELFTPDIIRTWLSWSFKRNGPKFLLDIVQVWSTTTASACLRLLLPTEVQPVIYRQLIWLFPPSFCIFNRCVQ